MKRIGQFATALLALSFSASATLSQDALNIGIVTFSTSDVDTNQMVDTMTQRAQGKGWTVEALNANGDPSQAITAIKQLAVDAIIVTVFDRPLLRPTGRCRSSLLSAGGGGRRHCALRKHRRRPATLDLMPRTWAARAPRWR